VRRIIVSEGVTLDGYFAGAAGEIDWQSLDEEFNAYSVELLDSVDTLLFGRVTYEQMRAWWPTPAGESYSTEIARRMNAVAKLVVSRAAVDVSWANTTQVYGDLPKAVAELKARSGKDIAILGSGSLVGQLTDLGLIDEYRLTVNPVILAGGAALFKDARERRNLRLLGVREFASGTLLLRYEPGPGR
jgi:dihydrofolate reductase